MCVCVCVNGAIIRLGLTRYIYIYIYMCVCVCVCGVNRMLACIGADQSARDGVARCGDIVLNLYSNRCVPFSLTHTALASEMSGNIMSICMYAGMYVYMYVGMDCRAVWGSRLESVFESMCTLL